MIYHALGYEYLEKKFPYFKNSLSRDSVPQNKELYGFMFFNNNCNDHLEPTIGYINRYNKFIPMNDIKKICSKFFILCRYRR